MEKLKKYITEIKDFPTKGIYFKDLNPIYSNPSVFKELTEPLEKLIIKTKTQFLAGIESRGFITAAALAYKLEIGLILVRKANKLPGKVIGLDYELEYNSDRLEIQLDDIKEKSNVLVVDDLLATGGTASAAGKLLKNAGANLIGYGFLVELTSLRGREILDQNLHIESVIRY